MSTWSRLRQSEFEGKQTHIQARMPDVSIVEMPATEKQLRSSSSQDSAAREVRLPREHVRFSSDNQSHFLYWEEPPEWWVEALEMLETAAAHQLSRCDGQKRKLERDPVARVGRWEVFTAMLLLHALDAVVCDVKPYQVLRQNRATRLASQPSLEMVTVSSLCAVSATQKDAKTPVPRVVPPTEAPGSSKAGGKSPTRPPPMLPVSDSPPKDFSIASSKVFGASGRGTTSGGLLYSSEGRITGRMNTGSRNILPSSSPKATANTRDRTPTPSVRVSGRTPPSARSAQPGFFASRSGAEESGSESSTVNSSRTPLPRSATLPLKGGVVNSRLPARSTPQPGSDRHLELGMTPPRPAPLRHASAPSGSRGLPARR